MADPRFVPPLTARDRAALRFVGEAGEVLSYQLRAAVFPGRTSTVLYRSLGRLKSRKLISMSREKNLGEAKIHITTKGALLLEIAGVDPRDLFIFRRPIASREAPHRLWATDVTIALAGLVSPPDRILPYWSLERRLNPRPKAIPDLLATWSARGADSAIALAIEVDLGGESIKRTLIPKLETLCDLLTEKAGNAHRSILVLASKRSRIRAVEKAADGIAGPVRITAALLPNRAGETALPELALLFVGTVQSIAHPTGA